MNDLFIIATREAYRFPSSYMNVTLEQLWSLPLDKPGKVSLNDVATTIYHETQAVVQVSFVETNSNDAKLQHLNNMLEIVKYIIGVKQAEAKAKLDKAAAKKEKEFLMEVLERKQKGKAEEMTEAEIQERIKHLSQ